MSLAKTQSAQRIILKKLGDLGGLA